MFNIRYNYQFVKAVANLRFLANTLSHKRVNYSQTHINNQQELNYNYSIIPK